MPGVKLGRPVTQRHNVDIVAPCQRYLHPEEVTLLVLQNTLQLRLLCIYHVVLIYTTEKLFMSIFLSKLFSINALTMCYPVKKLMKQLHDQKQKIQTDQVFRQQRGHLTGVHHNVDSQVSSRRSQETLQPLSTFKHLQQNCFNRTT